MAAVVGGKTAGEKVLALFRSISVRRCAAYSLDSSGVIGWRTKAGSARYAPRSAQAIFCASLIAVIACALPSPMALRSKPSRMFNISSIVVPPLVAGGAP